VSTHCNEFLLELWLADSPSASRPPARTNLGPFLVIASDRSATSSISLSTVLVLNELEAGHASTAQRLPSNEKLPDMPRSRPFLASHFGPEKRGKKYKADFGRPPKEKRITLATTIVGTMQRCAWRTALFYHAILKKSLKIS
jgi:hypothetical protein